MRIENLRRIVTALALAGKWKGEQGGEAALLRIADAPDFVKPFRLKRA